MCKRGPEWRDPADIDGLVLLHPDASGNIAGSGNDNTEEPRCALQKCRAGELSFIAIILVGKPSLALRMGMDEGRNQAGRFGLVEQAHEPVGLPGDMPYRCGDKIFIFDGFELMRHQPPSLSFGPGVRFDVGDAEKHVGRALRSGPLRKQGPDLLLMRTQQDKIMSLH